MRFRPSVPLVVLLTTALAAAPATGQESARGRGAGVVSLPAGIYHPFYVSVSDTAGVTVDAFRLDVQPVTVAEFLSFVVVDPDWLRIPVQSVHGFRSKASTASGDVVLPFRHIPSIPS